MFIFGFSLIVRYLVIIFSLYSVLSIAQSNLKPRHASSCSELWLRYNIRQSGNYVLNLQTDHNNGSEDLITVECDMRNALSINLFQSSANTSNNEDEFFFGKVSPQTTHYEIRTIIHHDSEETGTVQGYESPGSFSRDINYLGVKSLKQIEKIINSSFSCQQFIRWECRGATFSFWYPNNFHSWWVDRTGRPQKYWGNAEPDSNTCGCFPYCYPTVKNSTCNCDANLKTKWLEDSGLLLGTDRLPVTQLRFGDTGESYEAGKYTLGPLVCRSGGHQHLYMENRKAPTTLVSPGYPNQYPPEFRHYEWRILVDEDQLIELVFSDYDVLHYGAYNNVPGCRYTLEIDIYVQNSSTNTANQTDNMKISEYELDNNWIKVESIKREKASPPYYVTDGRKTLFVIQFITCNQVCNVPQENKGFRAEFRQSKCAACNVASVTTNTECFVKPAQCVYIYSFGYPFPHYLYGQAGQTITQKWKLTTNAKHVLQIEFNDFDVISTPGHHYCDADLLTLNELSGTKIIKKVDYCNINRFNIGKYRSDVNQTELILKTTLKKMGNSRGIHATVHSVPHTRTIIKWIKNASEGKPTDQSSTRGAQESSFAVDGNPEQRDPKKCSSTNYEREPWWRVNLQKRHRIHGVHIFNLVRKQASKVIDRQIGETLPPLDEIRWPEGNYALPMPVSGCPRDSNQTWSEGMRFHAVQHDKPYDDKTRYWSEGIMLKGGATGLGIEQHFCVHRSTGEYRTNRNFRSQIEDESSEKISWMPGKYCIFQYGETCPEGFHSGSLTWFDKSHNNHQSKLDTVNFIRGNTPKGDYTTHNTTIYFCCREDGNPEIPIRLPTTRPFYLFQYGQICQEVEGMSEVEHFFHYEEEVALSGSSLDFIFISGQQLKFQDPHPRIDVTLFDRGLTLHYCYYDIADKLKGFQVLVDTTPDTFGYGRFYDNVSGIARPVNKPFLSAVECASYSVTADEFDQIILNCTQPIEGQYVIIFMKDRQDALKLCEVRVFGEESCGRPLGMATEEVLDSAITASSFDQSYGLLYHPYNVRLNSPKAWCAQNSDKEKFIQIDLRLQNSNIVLDYKSPVENESNWNNINYVTVVGLAMQGMQMTFKSYFVTQFQLLFSNDSLHWVYEEEPIGKPKMYKCVQCEAQHIDGNEIVMYNLLKPIVTRFIRIKIASFRLGPCMRLELIGCRGDKKNFCSRTLTANTPGVISSPNYPFYYAQYKSCVWQIKPSRNNGHIELDFIVLDLAPAEKSGGKCHDQLLIYHSNQQNPISIEAGTGFLHKSYHFRQHHFPKKIISNGLVTISLRTCFRFSMSRYQGFLLRFRETDCPGCGIGDSRCSRIHNCTSLCGRILSINHPLNYVNNHRCQWLIRAPAGHYFNVTIEDFDIADTTPFGSKSSQRQRVKQGCLFDHLSFTDTSNGMLLGRYCNSNKPPKYILSNWNELLIEFSTDSSVTGRGFKLKYKAQKYKLFEEALPLLKPSPNACPFGWLYFRGYCYSAFVERESLQWYQAEEKCAQKLKGRDGHLVSITDYLEMNVVHYWIIEHWKFSPLQSIYIGLIDTNREGFYNWSDGNPMSYTDWYRTNLPSWSSPVSSFKKDFINERNKTWAITNDTDENSQPNTVNFDDFKSFNKHSQPDGGAFEDCTVIYFHSIHSTANWHDIPCSLGKKVMPVKGTNAAVTTPTETNTTRRFTNKAISDGLIRSYICKMDSNSTSHQHSPRRTLFNRVISYEERQSVKTRVNQNRYFVCNNYEVISNLFRCDGTANCRDGSDETESCPINDKCLDSQFQCSNGHCIAIGKYCDFVDDCGDGSDEISCIRRQCKKNSEFKCNNGQCIPISKRCDLLPDCRDQSDEGVSCSGGKCNLNTTFQCYYGSCIPLYALCDKHRDCPGKFYEDEHESVCSTLFEDGQFAFDVTRTLRSTNNLYRWKRDTQPSVEGSYSVLLSTQTNNSKYSLELIDAEKPRFALPFIGSSYCSNQKHKRTCQDLLDNFNITTDAYYELLPSPKTKLTLTAYCRFLNATHAMTIINHDTEDRLYVRSSVDGPGSYVRSITYEASFDLIVSLIDLSGTCRQLLSYECSGSGFYFNTSKPNSWWVSRNNAKEFSWGGDKKNSCACYPNCSSSNLYCNCDSGVKFNWTRDYGFVQDKNKLPIRQVAFGDVYRIGQLGYVQVGALECIGNAISSEKNSTPQLLNMNSNSKPFCDSNASSDSQLVVSQQFTCNSGQIIESKYICLYEFDQLGYQIGCRDVSHLRDCAHFQCPADYVKCPDSYCIPHRYICNGKWDCVGGSDEIGCARYSCPGKYKCANESSCILLHQLCDSFRHCPLGDDEWFCDLTCPNSCTCIGLYINCRNSNITFLSLREIPKETRKLDLSNNNLGPDLSSIDFSPFADLGELILQNNNIEIIRSRKFIQLTNLYKLDLRFNHIKVIEAGAFAGLQQVTSLLLENNHFLQEIHSGAFVGLVSLRKLNISNTQLSKIERNLFLQMSSLQTLIMVNNQIETVEKGAFNDLISLVSLDLRTNPINNFPKDMFNMLKSLRFLSTDSFKFCCLASGIVPFERCYPPQDEISDCEDLMSNTVQRLILWVLGIVAFFGNLIVVIWRYKTLTHTNPVSSTLILSLGCSDFLMGIYLLIIASVDEHYRGRYIENSDYWKSSSLCKFCGFLSTISSEMSVVTLVFITIDRLISICFSFYNYRFTVNFTKRLLIITWILMFLISAVPLLPINYFNGQFYSRSGVCLALHITTCRSPGWEYSVAIFLFLNLFAFLFILTCYCYMYNTISVSARKMKHMRAKQVRETRIGRQMALIVISNFLCWFPVIIMGFLALAGITIPGAAYSWTAVVVLPLNSATNPLIYTLLQFIPKMLANTKPQERHLVMTGNSVRNVTQQSSYMHPNLNNGPRPTQMLLRPPPGYQTLGDFIRHKEPLTTRDLLEVCHSLSNNLKDFHQIGYALGTLNFDNIFVTKIPVIASEANKRIMLHVEQDSNEPINGTQEQTETNVAKNTYQLQTYIPGFSAYRVADSCDADDFAVDMEEFGLVVKRMLQLYHARLMKSSTNSVNFAIVTQAHTNRHQSVSPEKNDDTPA